MLPRFEELLAPPGWATLEFISDIHLQPEVPATFDAWRRFMAQTRADALFILGDLFEVWVGDDAAREPGFAADCAAVLQATARRLPVFFMHGNRDFLVGAGLLGTTGITALNDPTVLDFADQRWLLSHGDALCIGDTDYQAFRAQVRGAEWQSQFLAQPLAVRKSVARGLRAQSEARAQSGVTYSDVDAPTAVEWLQAADARTLIHGHTHQPADHPLPGGRRRIVLTDWDASVQPPRMEILRLTRAGAERVRWA